MGDSSSSSGEEDGDAEWKAAIDSVAGTNNGLAKSTSNGDVPTTKRSSSTTTNHKDIKRYQLKAQELLDKILGKSIEIVSDPTHDADNDSKIDGGGVRLFKDAPVGIVFDHASECQGPRRRPRIVPGKELDEKSKKFKHQVESVTVDGMKILTAAKDACQKSLAKMEARDAARKAAVKKEEERVAELKKIRGERWLPSIAKNMQAKS
ncbi:uncharacterized protein LOC108193986 [Daucus carota subsp. sativus]|uniref:Uncharacterized protein n=1 Tax=Daucus carota subsp. sativus TaxID=79200 RepID=A0A164UCY5_DAUCS|nr:PREDICTED: uncharacterized protein LOC108193986 [Daucus carota subsp. sativus]